VLLGVREDVPVWGGLRGAVSALWGWERIAVVDVAIPQASQGLNGRLAATSHEAFGWAT
jgi:hypothetical protein